MMCVRPTHCPSSQMSWLTCVWFDCYLVLCVTVELRKPIPSTITLKNPTSQPIAFKVRAQSRNLCLVYRISVRILKFWHFYVSPLTSHDRLRPHPPKHTQWNQIQVRTIYDRCERSVKSCGHIHEPAMCTILSCILFISLNHSNDLICTFTVSCDFLILSQVSLLQRRQ